jgi:hypothetical protein
MLSIKTSRLENLPDGSPFVIPALPDHFALLYLVRGGQSTCKVQGYKKTDAGGYCPMIDFFAPATAVLYDNTRKQLSISKEGTLSIPREYMAEILNEAKEEKQEEKKVNNKTKKTKGVNKMSIETINMGIPTKNVVGRPKKYNIELPHGEEFTVSNVAAKLGVKKFVINNEIARIQRETPDILRVVGSVPQGKGKPARVFKLH